MDTDKIISFCKFFKSVIRNVENEIQNKNKILTFKDILYCCLYMNGTSSSYSLTNINMYINNIVDISDTVLKKERNTIDYTYFKQVSDSLLDFIYEYVDEPRIIGVDGTYIPLSIKLKENNFRTSKRNTYCISLISSLFDINNKILINYNLCKNMDERKGLIDQLEYLREGDILVIDRGYYSKKLLMLLHENKINAIFRMRENSLVVKKMIKKG
jgi:hypothetical protein